MPTNLDEFNNTYIKPSKADRKTIYVDVTTEVHQTGHEHGQAPWIVISDNYGRTAIIDVIAFGDHLCIDVHPFLDGEDARVGIFGLDNGRRQEFPDDQVSGTSHGWNATRQAVLLIGHQEDNDENA